MRNALERLRGCAAHHADDVVALLQEEFREIGPVLPGDTGDERSPLIRTRHGMILAGRTGALRSFFVQTFRCVRAPHVSRKRYKRSAGAVRPWTCYASA